jgi:hypothetical protein
MLWKLVFEIFFTFDLSQALPLDVACCSGVFGEAHGGDIEVFATLSINTFGVDGVDYFGRTTNL